MSNNDTPRTPGPWDRTANEPKVVRLDDHRDERPAVDPTQALDQGQHPAVAIGGTALFFGFIWWLTGSWIVALALIFGLFVHEYGHVLAMNRLGTGPARIYIIPFLGGVARSQRMPASEWHDVLISLAGPLFGLLAAIPFVAVYFWLGDPQWMLAAFVVCMLNLINLAPAPPLDGSRAIGPVLARINPLLEQGVMLAVGATVVIWALTRGSWIFGAFLAIALFARLRQGHIVHPGRPLSGAESLKSTAAYLGTAALCVGASVGVITLLTGDPVGGWFTVLRYFGF